MGLTSHPIIRQVADYLSVTEATAVALLQAYHRVFIRKQV